MITDVIVHFYASDTIAFEVSNKIKFLLIAHWTEWRGECAREATGASSMLRLIRRAVILARKLPALDRLKCSTW
jgi:hypothetical protein